MLKSMLKPVVKPTIKPVLKSTIAQQNKRSAIPWALIGLSLTVLLSSLGTSIANVGLPTLANAFSASFQQVQWIVLAYLLAITSLIVSVGRLGDVLGRRRLLLLGLVLFTVASMLCGLASSLGQLIAARALQGIGAAAMMALTMAFVGDITPKEKTGSAMGLLGTMSAIGTALGPSLGGLLIVSLGWRSIFFINLPLGIVALLLAWRHLPLDVDRQLSNAERSRFDPIGTLLLAFTLAAYALAMTLGHGSFGFMNVMLLVAAVLGLAFFLVTQTRVATPLIRLEIFRNSTLSAGFATSSLVATMMMATLVVGPFYLSGALALSTASVGLVMSIGPIISAFIGVPAGRLVDKFGARKMSIIGLGSMLTGTVVLSVTPTTLGVPGYLVPLAITTMGYALFQAANNTGVMANIPAQERGTIAGMLNLSRNLGLITGASLMGALFALGSKSAETIYAHALAHGMHITFAFAAVLILFALVIAVINKTRTSLISSINT